MGQMHSCSYLTKSIAALSLIFRWSTNQVWSPDAHETSMKVLQRRNYKQRRCSLPTMSSSRDGIPVIPTLIHLDFVCFWPFFCVCLPYLSLCLTKSGTAAGRKDPGCRQVCLACSPGSGFPFCCFCFRCFLRWGDCTSWPATLSEQPAATKSV